MKFRVCQSPALQVLHARFSGLSMWNGLRFPISGLQNKGCVSVIHRNPARHRRAAYTKSCLQRWWCSPASWTGAAAFL